MFERAIKRKVFLKLATTGPTGSGKTLSSLLLAKGLISHLPPRKELHKNGDVKSRVCVIDSENESASLYEKHPLLKGFFFDTSVIHPPFTVQKYQAALNEALKAGYDVCLMDSISHAWAGDGGLLAKKEHLDNGGGGRNKFSNWGEITKDHEKFKSSILQSAIHIICTMRSKTEYLQVEENGKQKIIKAGMAPIQRDGIEYEFTTVLDFDTKNLATASKDRTGLFSTENGIKVTEETGKKIRAWLDDGIDAPPQQPIEEPSKQPNQQTNQRPSNIQNQDTNQPQNSQKNTSTTPQSNQNSAKALVVKKYWSENPIRFEDSVIHFGRYNGMMFKDIGHTALHDALQYAIKNADPKVPTPKEFLELAKFVQNWHEELGEREVAESFNVAEPPEQSFDIAEPPAK